MKTLRILLYSACLLLYPISTRIFPQPGEPPKPWAYSLLTSNKLQYPVAKTVDVTEEYHGTKVADPYRWMEDLDSPELAKWIEAENKLTYGFLERIPERAKIKERLTQLWNYPRYTTPFRQGSRYFYFKNDGLQNQSVLYKMEGLDGEPKVLIDPNALSADGTAALSSQSYTHDGTLLAYGVSRSGSDRQEIFVRNVNTGKDLDDVIKWCKFASIAWTRDNKGFYYNRLPEPGTVPKEDESNFSKVYWHTLGTPQASDKLVYERPDEKELGFAPFMTDDGRYLFLRVSHGTDRENRLYYRESDGEFIKLLDEADASYGFIDNVGTTIYLNTDLSAPKGKVIAIDLKNPARKSWKEIIPESDDVLSSISMVNGKFVATYIHDAHSVMKIFDADGHPLRAIGLPALGTVGGVSGNNEDKDMFFTFTSFLYPPTIYRYVLDDNLLSVFRKTEIAFDPSLFETIQVFAPSKDGTKIPVYLTYKKGLKLDGSNPALLNAYGGFALSQLPSFSASRLLWLENGGIFALANLRGGLEYGETWHQAGMLANKQNVFDDFIAAARWMIDNKYTSSPKLAIQGGSNGGLLVSACLLQQPQLYGAVIDQVPVTDMLRYHKFTVGRYWTGEYGNAEKNADQFKFMYAYSPLHNVKKGATYPPTLITTADHDDRVVPSHAMKFCATLQAADGGENPILIRVDTKAGHGGGKPTSKQIDELTDIYAFLFKVLKMQTAQ